MDSDPLETIVRKVLLYPASGEEPHVVDMAFSEAGSKYSRAYYTRALDLRPLYNRCMSGIRDERRKFVDQPGTRDDGIYIIYFNIDPKLPSNQAMGRIVGVNPALPNSRPIMETSEKNQQTAREGNREGFGSR